MFFSPDPPPLDKDALIGACARLPLAIDAARLRAEVEALPATLWGTRGGRVGVHNAAQAVFLRGHAPAEGKNLPIDDRDELAQVPYAREIITQLLPAPAQRCLLALLPAGGVVYPHRDRGEYFFGTIRIHIPVITHEQVQMYCDGRVFTMRPGEVWALNNSARHAVRNNGTLPRTHMICDFLPTPALCGLLARTERDLGIADAGFEQRLLAEYPA